MKIITSMLVALSVVASLAAPASATFTNKTKQVYDKVDRQGIN